MTKNELRARRDAMVKTQQQLADLLGISVRAIHSFEQGWREIPVHVERQILFLAMLAHATNKPIAHCWTVMRCPTDVRKKCPAWELKAGKYCWFINGTLCKGASRRTWKAKMEICGRCKVFLAEVGPAVSAN